MTAIPTPQINLSRPQGPARRRPPRTRSSPTAGGGADSTDVVGSSVQRQGRGVSEGEEKRTSVSCIGHLVLVKFLICIKFNFGVLSLIKL